MQSMSEDDVAYSALLAQLLSDSAPTRDARVHSWIEHQYDFVLSEHRPFPSSRPPSPSPSSSLGAHRACSIDRPDSPLLPRPSTDRTASPCPSYDALFFSTPAPSDDFEEKERVRALRFIVQEMAHYKSQGPRSPNHDKPLPAPPPSPASSLTSSRPMRSRSCSTSISRLPSFTSTLSSDQSHPQEVPPPLPVSVIVHGEYQHDLILRRDAYSHKREDSFTHSLSHDHDAQYLTPITDDKDSLQPSPTLSNFSFALSRETSVTSLYASSPASPTAPLYSPCTPENIALPASPLADEKPFFATAHDRTPSSRSTPSLNLLSMSPPKMHVFPASPTSPAQSASQAAERAPLHLRPSEPASRSQSRWSVATTASLTPSTVEPKPKDVPDWKSSPKDKKSLKTPKKRARFISLISRFSPGRNDPTSTTSSNQASNGADSDSANESEPNDKDKKIKKSLSKKSSLASLRASFSLSRASFSSQRPPLSSMEEVPPLPTSPTLAAPMSELMLSDSVPRPSLSRVSSRGNILDSSSFPPIPQSASTIATFQSTSQVSVADSIAQSAFDSRVSLASPSANPSGSRISLLQPLSKRTSLASAAGVEPMISTKPVSATRTTRSKSIFRLTAKPKTIKMPISPGAKETAPPSRLPIAGNMTSSSPMGRSRIPQGPTKFNPPAKLATVIATQSRQAPAPACPGLPSPTSKLPTAPSRVPSKVPRPSTALEKPLVQSHPSVSTSSRLPMPAATKTARVGTVKGFWKRQ